MDITEKSINYLKSLTAETISNAGSGHTGSAIGASSILFALFKDHLIFDPHDPTFLNRDRFVLSAGHASGLLYSILHMFGYDISIDDLKKFRKYGSKTAGHPEYGVAPGVEVTTGPLGQGVANAVGMALAESFFEAKLASQNLNFINNYTYCYAGDGCLMEGVAVEACSLAGTLKLNKLILLYDDNNITIDGSRTLANNEDTKAKFEAMGWNTIEVAKGNDYHACTKAIEKAKNSKKPTIIIFKTTIGIGTSKQGTCKVHAYPLPAEELKSFKNSLGILESFEVPQDVLEYCKHSTNKNKVVVNNWYYSLKQLKESKPELFKEFSKIFTSKKINYEKIVNALNKQPAMAGRDISGMVLTEIAKTYTELFGGTADLGASTKAVIADSESYSSKNRLGRNIHFGIREHAMGSICNGMALYAGTPVFDSTFLAFSTYMIPSLKMRAMMNIPVLSVFSHDSIDIGEDGPTHQPIEQIASLRNIIGLNVFRPATKAEVVATYKWFLENKKPTALVITKSKIDNFENSTIENAEHGAYVIFETKTKPQIEIFATGKDVELAISVAQELEGVGARVISVLNEKLYDSQDKTYKNKVRLKSPILKVAIEASNDLVWLKYIGENGLLVNVNEYQHSGKGSEVYSKAGFNKENILKQIAKKLK